MDIARHVPLYKALLNLVRAIASCSKLAASLLFAESDQSIPLLLHKLDFCVSGYVNQLK